MGFICVNDLFNILIGVLKKLQKQAIIDDFPSSVLGALS